MKTRRWLFVTGAPRSGTTFVGKVLSAPLQVDYLHEPFNPRCGMRGIDEQYLYLRPGAGNPTRYVTLVGKLFEHDFSLRRGYFKEDSAWHAVAKRLVGSRYAWRYRLAKVNPLHRILLIKDPIGCLLTEYLFETHGVEPVIVIRHPVAMVASLLRLQWRESLQPIRSQPSLVADYFQDEREFLNSPRDSVLEAGAAVWRALNKVLLRQAARHPSWTVRTHEAICRDPVGEFSALYRALDLRWTRRIERKVLRMTGARNPVVPRTGDHQQFRRDSAALLARSPRLLSRAERRVVYRITRDVALQVYGEESFGL